jgi:hypothetical protein
MSKIYTLILAIVLLTSLSSVSFADNSQFTANNNFGKNETDKLYPGMKIFDYSIIIDGLDHERTVTEIRKPLEFYYGSTVTFPIDITRV